MAMEKPDRDTAFGSISAFDDKSEGFLPINALAGILAMGGDAPLSDAEMGALMLEINNGIADGSKITIDNLVDFLFRQEETLFKANNYEFVQKQMDAAIALGGITTVAGGDDGGKKKKK